MIRKLLLLTTMILALCGCPRRQPYEQPSMPTPAAWPDRAVTGAEAPGPSAADLGWREFFADPKLLSVIELAIENNRDLRLAALNVERVQAMYRIQRTQQYPVVNAGAAADVYRVPEEMSSGGDAETIAQYTLSLGSTAWELDLFGRIRSLKQQALEQYLATEQARLATQISLVAAVTNGYLNLAADEENLRLARATLAVQQEMVDLIRRSRDVGMSSDLEVRQAQSQVDAARVDIARYTGLVGLDKNALDQVVGAPLPADLLPDGLDTVGDFQEVSPGLPSEVLLRRPDIRTAEHQLKAAYANIEAARAMFFPRISLTAGIGLVSSDLADLFTIGARTWNFAPQAVLPIFDSGARRANYDVAQSDRDMMVVTYDKMIQAAFREVSDTLILRTALQDQQQAQEELVGTLAEAVRLAEARYKAGIDGYLNTLVAQRELYAARQGLVGVRLAGRSNHVTLYKVLGGGSKAGSPSSSPTTGRGTPPTSGASREDDR